MIRAFRLLVIAAALSAGCWTLTLAGTTRPQIDDPKDLRARAAQHPRTWHLLARETSYNIHFRELKMMDMAMMSMSQKSCKGVKGKSMKGKGMKGKKGCTTPAPSSGVPSAIPTPRATSPAPSGAPSAIPTPGGTMMSPAPSSHPSAKPSKQPSKRPSAKPSTLLT